MFSLPVTQRTNFTPPFNGQQRVKELEDKVADFKRRMSITTKTDLAFLGFEDNARANFGKRMIELPTWYLFKHEDIPSRFLIQDINDPRLVDERFLEEFSNWINDKLTEGGLSSIRRSSTPSDIQRLILLLRDRDLFEKTKDFTIGHELGHIAYSKEKYLWVGVMTAGIIGLTLSLLLAPIIALAMSSVLAVAGSAFAITGIAAGIFSAGLYCLPKLSGLEQEKKADLDSVKMLKDATGGIYNFETHMMFNRRIRLQDSQNESKYDEKGNNLRDKKHPLLSDRVAYLQHWQFQPTSKKEAPKLMHFSTPVFTRY